jgi:dTDP-4-amino-4,6-dideoxygalactose transaminase
MTLRRQLPVRSPLTLAALGRGAAALANPDAAWQLVQTTLTERYDASEVLLTDSGTAALTIALRIAMAARPGRPVALPAYCCYDLATAADGAGVEVLLYDVDPRTLAPEPRSLGDALAAGAGSVVLVHLYGIPVPLAELTHRIHAAGALVIEDAAQGAGGSIAGRRLGAGGDLAILSFGRGKGLTAGRGGCLMVHDESLRAEATGMARALAGRASSVCEAIPALVQWALARPALYGIPAALPFLRLGDTVYHPATAPRSASWFSLGVLRETLELVEDDGIIRRQHAAVLLAAMSTDGDATAITPAAGSMPGYLRLPLMAGVSMRRRTDAKAARRLGIMPGYPRALCDLAGFEARVRNRAAHFPGARALAAGLLTLPTHGALRPRDLTALTHWLGVREAPQGAVVPVPQAPR